MGGYLQSYVGNGVLVLVQSTLTLTLTLTKTLFRRMRKTRVQT